MAVVHHLSIHDVIKNYSIASIQPQRLESCYCNTDDTRARPSTEIQAKHYDETVQVTNVNEYVRIYATKPRNSFEREFYVRYILDQRTEKYWSYK